MRMFDEIKTAPLQAGRLSLVEPFTIALEVVAEVMRDGIAIHPDNEWTRRSVDYHLARAEEHLRLLHDGDQREDHVAHAATRLLMALTLRELG